MKSSMRAAIGFFIVMEVADCSEFPFQAVDCLAEVLDEWKPVIIQWDLIHSAENLVFLKKNRPKCFHPTTDEFSQFVLH